MKIIYMGTPHIAIKPLEKLFNHPDIDIPLVICQPDKPKGRGKKMSQPPVKEFAIDNNIKVYQPDTLKNNTQAVEILRKISPDFFVVVAYGKILPVQILSIPRFAPINIHFSLLPKYRGAAPVNWTIINGDKYTGVSTMIMSEGLDKGDILLQKSTDIDKKTSIELSEELSEMGADLICQTITNFQHIKPRKQDESKSSYAPIIKKQDGLIDWDNDACYIERQIRGFQPWPSAYTFLNGKLMKIFKAEVIDNNREYANGEIVSVDKKSFIVKCGNNSLQILELQMEGKKRTSAESFLAGSKLETGTKLG
jgi:methionyl-tRNA formyltransferase